MSRKLAVSLILLMLGLASLDAVWNSETTPRTNDVQAQTDGTGIPPE